MASVDHPKLDCIYNAAKCIVGGRDCYFVIKRQAEFLHSQNYPRHNGLYENNLIFRKHNDELIKKISADWWTIYMQYSKRDQLSLCYILWKKRFTPELLFSKGVSNRNSTCVAYTKNPKQSFAMRLKNKIESLSNQLAYHLFLINKWMISLYWGNFNFLMLNKSPDKTIVRTI